MNNQIMQSVGDEQIAVNGNRWKTNYNAHLFPRVDEKNYQPSLTVPNQSLSIKEILTRYAQGLGVDGIKVPVYNGEEDFDIDVKRLDLAEIQELKEANYQRIADLRKEMQDGIEKTRTKFKEQEIPFEEIKPNENSNSNSNNPPKDNKNSTESQSNKAPEKIQNQ